MPFSLKLPEKDSTLIIILAVIYLAARLPLLTTIPFVQDEAMYAVMIGEQAAHPQLIPTFLDYPVSWKPPLFFSAYALFPKPFASFELSYRLPSLLFGLLTVPLLYMVLRRAAGRDAGRAVPFFSILIYILSFPVSYPQTAILQDSMMFFFICASLYLYVEAGFGRWRYPVAGVLAALAFFVKLVPAFIIPVLAVGYIYLTKKEELREPLFILSLLAVPAAMALHIYMLGPALSSELYLADIGSKIGGVAGSQAWIGWAIDRVSNALSSLMFCSLDGTILWLSLSLVGVARFWRVAPFMTLWYALGAIPLASAFLLPWYFLPIMPAVAYFAALTLIRWDGKEKMDAFFAIFMCLLLALSAFAMAAAYIIMTPGYEAEKAAGLLLSGKENVLIIGGYRPGVVAYKVLDERQAGKELDFGWVLHDPNMTKDETEAFLADYHARSGNVTDGSFSAFFTSNRIFRKDTNITHFDYVALIQEDGISMAGTELIYNKSGILIYHRTH
jgi:4-amino-4-deoxy-L-arabinose transferase-like glycosyltransferase